MSRIGRVLDEPGRLAALDGIVVLVVLLVGEVHHYGLGGLTDLAAVGPLLLSFLVGWYAVAVLIGLYERTPEGTARHSLRTVAVTALAGANVGLIVRSLVFGDPQVSPFPAVITATLLVATCGVRALVRWRVRTVRSRSLGASERQAQD